MLRRATSRAVTALSEGMGDRAFSSFHASSAAAQASFGARALGRRGPLFAGARFAR